MKEDFDTIKKGSIVQVVPEFDSRFGGCLIVVTEVRAWGVQGFIEIPGDGGRAYYRASWDGIEPTGGAVKFLPEEELGDEP